MLNDKAMKQQLFGEIIANDIGNMADRLVFSQEDLDYLFEKGVEEILICGNNLHIPLVNRSVLYVGINTPTVVIDSSEVIDLADMGIMIRCCCFDEAYSRLLQENSCSEIEHDTADDMKEVCKEEEIRFFYESLKEYIEDYREEITEMERDDDLSDFFEIDEVDPDEFDSGKYEHATKAKVKLACKECIEKMLLRVKRDFINSTKDYLHHSDEYYNALKGSFIGFIGDFSEAYDSYAVSECSDELKNYLMSIKDEIFMATGGIDMDTEIKAEEIERMVAEKWDKKVSLRILLQECDFDEDDGYYCYDISKACDTVNSEIEDFQNELENILSDQIYGVYVRTFIEKLELIKQKFDEVMPLRSDYTRILRPLISILDIGRR